MKGILCFNKMLSYIELALCLLKINTIPFLNLNNYNIDQTMAFTRRKALHGKDLLFVMNIKAYSSVKLLE
jgi:hypothetical protein